MASVQKKAASKKVQPISNGKHPSSFSIPVDAVNPYSAHEVFNNNNVPYVIAGKNDTYKKIADEFDMALWQVFKYNEIDSHTPLAQGQRIYIKPKKRNGTTEYYVVKDGETLHDIAQQQGIKMRLLKKWNKLDDNAEVHGGEKLWLKRM